MNNLVNQLLAAGFKNTNKDFDGASYGLGFYGLYGNTTKHEFENGEQTVIIELARNGGAPPIPTITFIQAGEELSKQIGVGEPNQDFLKLYLKGSIQAQPYDPKKDKSLATSETVETVDESRKTEEVKLNENGRATTVTTPKKTATPGRKRR